MGEQKPRKPISSHWGNHDSGLAQRPQQQEPRKVISSYYGQAASPVILGLDTDTGQPISVNQLDLCSGTYIDGIQGMGKTSLLEQIVYQQMQADEAVIVIDPHGDLVNSIVTHMPANKLSKTYLLDLKDRAYPFGLSVFACSNPEDEEERDTTRNQIMHAFQKLWPETQEGQYFKKILRHLVITLIENPTLTLANVRRLLLDENYRQQYTGHLQNSETRAFWHDEYNRLSESKRTTQTNPFLGRLDELLTEPVIKTMLQQTTKTVNIRTLIEEWGILLVKLPVNEEAYKYSAPVVGTLLMAMIYAAIFSFTDIPMEHRPGCTLVVDEFQNFATDEYAKLFEQGRKYKVKQFLAHQHRQQLERGTTGKTNLAATLSANTIIAFRTIPEDARALASFYTGIAEKRRPTDIFIHPLEKIDTYSHPLVKQFVLDVVDKLDRASGGKLVTKRESYKDYSKRPTRYTTINWDTGVRRTEYSYPFSSYSYKVNPLFDFGAGEVETNPDKAEAALTLLDRLIYESEERETIVEPLKTTFIQAVTPFWKLASDKDEEKAEARVRSTRFVKLLDTVLAILIDKPIADDGKVTNSDVAGLLEDLEKRHAFVKTGSTAYSMKTRDTRLLQAPVTAQEAAQRLQQVREQTRARFCVPRSELAERETEEIEDEFIDALLAEEETYTEEVGGKRKAPRPAPVVTELYEPEALELPEPVIQRAEPPAHQKHEAQPPAPIPASIKEEYLEALLEIAEEYLEAQLAEKEAHEAPRPEPVQMETPEPEPLAVPEPALPLPQPPAQRKPKMQRPAPIPASMDSMNTLYAQMKEREIDPDTTILASLGEHYVMTIKQWMRLFERSTLSKATPYFKTLREQGFIFRKDREGRGGALVEGDWQFLLTKGANELAKRKQPSPLFKLEPNEAERASGDTLFHTYLVNEVLIHLRLLERSHPDIVRIERIDHERSMRRQYLSSLGTDTKLYPDGFMRLLVPTPNGLKRKHTFLELQHTTQKDKHNWQTKVRKYLALFDRPDVLERFFSTRTPQVLVLTMDTEYVAYHKQWTEEVLAARGERGRAYGNRFLIGAYDTGISDNTVLPVQFFCTPRFLTPFQATPHPFIGA